jgi:hypothetical protein
MNIFLSLPQKCTTHLRKYLLETLLSFLKQHQIHVPLLRYISRNDRQLGKVT